MWGILPPGIQDQELKWNQDLVCVCNTSSSPHPPPFPFPHTPLYSSSPSFTFYIFHPFPLRIFPSYFLPSFLPLSYSTFSFLFLLRSSLYSSFFPPYNHIPFLLLIPLYIPFSFPPSILPLSHFKLYFFPLPIPLSPPSLCIPTF